MELDHGGRLNRAARHFGIPPEQWLDLSTGINPRPWPVPEVPARIWQRLPEEDDGLNEIARRWLNVPHQAGCLPVPGSQAAIQALPRLRPRARVGVPEPGYNEHAHWWARAGHQVVPVPHDAVPAMIDTLDVLVWIHPNNPTGLLLPQRELLDWHARLARRGGWLVVDEAFVDPVPEASLAGHADMDGLIVLRSLGKFFGLAGLRAGLVCGPAGLCRELDRALGPWAVNHPARWIMARALSDHAWQAATRTWLTRAAGTLDAELLRRGLRPASGTGLFRYCPHPDAVALHEALARRGILTRLFREAGALRLGLPANHHERARLAGALDEAFDSLPAPC